MGLGQAEACLASVYGARRAFGHPALGQLGYACGVGQLPACKVGHGVAVDHLHQRQLGLQQQTQPFGTSAQVGIGGLDARHAAAVDVAGGEVEFLADGKVDALAHGRRVAPEVAELHFGVGRSDARAAGGALGFGAAGSGPQGRAVGFDLTQGTVVVLRAQRRGAEAGQCACYDGFRVHCLCRFCWKI